MSLLETLHAKSFKRAEEHGLHEAFEISIILKGLNAILEVALGVVFFFTARHSEFFIALIENAIIDDPNDFLGRHALTIVPYLDPKVQFFASIYLLIHGVVKGILVLGLLRNKLWSYPAAIGVFSLFVVYQVFKWVQHHSFPLIWLTVFDLIVIALISHEYRRRLKALRIDPKA
jgi:uncharacterized membrane protein